MTLPIVAATRLPETTRYPDRGCDIWPKCLECPLPKCKHDVYLSRKWVRNKVIVAMAEAEPTMKPPEIARRLKVGTRTVYRVLQAQREGPRARVC